MKFKNCSFCNKQFKQHRDSDKFCSMKCCGLSKRILLEKKCITCGSIFKVPPHKFKIRKVCSKKCGGIYRRSSAGKYVMCLQCNKEIYAAPRRLKAGRSKFCSKHCFNNWRSVNLVGLKNKNFRGIVKQCMNCGKDILLSKSQIVLNAKYCSIKCHNDYQGKLQSGSNNPNWKGGLSIEPYGIEFNKKLKNSIIEKYQFKCQQCFRHQDELYTKNGIKYSLNIHHVDYNKKNNHASNLIPLCKTCHTQTNFNREDWSKYYNSKIII